MTLYIDIDISERKLNGRLASLQELATKLAELQKQPARYYCLLRNDYRGKYRYADFQSADPGANTDHTE